MDYRRLSPTPVPRPRGSRPPVGRWTTGIARRLELVAFIAFLAALGALAVASPTLAATYGLSDTPQPWSRFCSDAPNYTHNCGQTYNYSGAPLRDYESQSGYSDPSAGATPNGAEDISSGFTGTLITPDPCNPVVAGGSGNCGLQPSAYFAYCQNCGGSGRDYIFLRMRVNGDPRFKQGFVSSHWNFLHDVDNDGFKEYWMDVNGSHSSNGPDRLRLLFEDTNSQTISNEQPARGAGVGSCGSGTIGGTYINEFLACNDSSLPGCANSFTRAVNIGDGTGEWWIDMQMPLDAFTLADGCGPGGGTWQSGTTNNVQAAQGLRYLFTTSNSSTDPLQKDRTAPGFGDLAPITLAHVRVRGGVLEWTTATETANVGFHVWARVHGERVRLTEHLVPSPAGDSLHPIRYRYPLPAGLDADALFLEDVDTTGVGTMHGPFARGGEYGNPRASESLVPIDWSAIRGASREDSSPRGAKVTASASAGSAAEAELFVSEDGLYRVSWEDLVAAGIDLSGVHPSRITLTLKGRAVPIRVVAGWGASSLGPGGYVEFFGQAADGLYTRTNVYRLGSEHGKVLRAAIGSTPTPAWRPTLYRERTTEEKELAYTFGPPAGAEPWYWDRLLVQQGKPALVRDYVVSVDLGTDGAALSSIFLDGFETGNTAAWGAPPPEPPPAVAAPPVLTVDLWGITNFPASPDHHVLVSLNGESLGDTWFDGLTTHSVSLPVPAGLLHEGDNTVTLTLPGDTGQLFDLVHLDRVAVEHSRLAVARDGVLDVASPPGPVTAVGLPGAADVVAYGLGPAGLTRLPVAELAGAVTVDPGAGTERLVVSSLSALKTPVVAPARVPAPVDQGPAEYLIVTDAQFRDALAPLVAARESQGWSVQVVDVEDLYLHYTYGIVDPEAIREHLRFAAENLGTEMVLLVGGDTYDYLDYLGLGSVSHVPTLYTRTGSLVGYNPVDPLLTDFDGDRIPDLPIGRLPARTVEELERMIAKTLAFDSAGNRGTAVFAADESVPGFDFDHESRTYIASYLSDWSVAEAYLDEMTPAAANGVLESSLQSGVALAHFFGHSAPGLWTYAGLYSAPEALGLTNEDPTLVLQWGCWNTYFVDPTADSMGTAFLEAEGGAAATMGASALTGLPADRDLAGLLLDRLTTPGTPIGVALHEAKRALALTDPQHEDVLLGWTLLGDPALVLEP